MSPPSLFPPLLPVRLEASDAVFRCAAASAAAAFVAAMARASALRADTRAIAAAPASAAAALCRWSSSLQCVTHMRSSPIDERCEKRVPCNV